MNDPLLRWLTSESVRDNAIVTLVVGGPLSVYLAFVVNRFATFRQTKFSALTEIALLQKLTLETDNCLKAQVAIRAILEVPVAALAVEKQISAARALHKLRGRLREYFLTEFAVEMAKRGITRYARLEGDDWVEAQQAIYMRARSVIRDAVKAIERLEPDYVQIFLGLPMEKPRPRRSDCGDCCDNCNRTI
ncbi:MAG: hypothetical protein HZC55_26610 [Verrucomicrobia bacterium]|nr:hypothetical protein [Verrucomicrobiota bacterium]